MPNISFSVGKCTNTFNDETVIKIDKKKIVDVENVSIDVGKHEVEIEQIHMYNTKFFVFAVLFSLFDLLINSVDAGYLPRRWGKYAYLTFEVFIERDTKYEIVLTRKRTHLLCDSYILSLEDSSVNNVKAYEKRNVFTISGVVLFWGIIISLIAFVIAIST